MSEGMTAESVRSAVDLTTQTIVDRLRIYGAARLGVLITLFGSLLGGALCRSWLALAGLSMWLPIIACYVAVDTWRVRRWRKAVSDLLKSGAITATVLSHVLRARRDLPAATITSMLALLPPDETDSA